MITNELRNQLYYRENWIEIYWQGEYNLYFVMIDWRFLYMENFCSLSEVSNWMQTYNLAIKSTENRITHEKIK